jgi:diguanylate cyclase (GGDEF)-like protein/PAS domain S-box-containing protein
MSERARSRRGGFRPSPSTLLLFAALLVLAACSVTLEVLERHWNDIAAQAATLVLVALVLVRLWRSLRARDAAEEGLRLSEHRLDALIRHSSDVIAVLDERATLSFVSSSATPLFGLSPDELVGRSALELVHPDDGPIVASTFAAAAGRPGSEGGIEVRVKDARGVWRWVEVRYSNQLGDPAVAGIVLDVRDIGSRFAAETALREREAQYRSLFEGNRAVMLLVDPATDEIVDANPAAVAFYGHAHDRLVSMSVRDLIADPGPAVLEEMRRANEEGRTYWHLRHRLADGVLRHVEVYAGPIAIGGRALEHQIVHDVTERCIAEEALRGAEARYRTLVEQLPVATYVYRFSPDDPSRTVGVYVGPQIEEMLGVTPQDWVGDPGLWARTVHPDDLARVDREGTAARASGTPIETEYRMVRPDGRVVWVHDSSVPVHDPDGAVIAWQGIYQDVTERREAENAVRRQALIFESVNDSVMVTDREGRIIDANAATERSVGRPRHEFLGRPASELIGTGDAGRTGDVIAAALAEQGRWSGVLPVRRADGSDGFVELTVVPLEDREGGLLGSVEVARDVTERRRSELALHASERRFRAVFDGAAIGIARLSLDAHILEANAAMAELLRSSRTELVGARLGNFVDELGDDRIPEEFVQLARGELDRYEVDRQYLLRGGRRIWLHVVCSLVRTEEGAPDFAIVMLEDVTARKDAEEDLAWRALHDRLTGLPTRELLLDRLGVALARIERGGAGVAVMFLDLDEFKQVNDELGHDAGDAVLVEVGRRFAASVRPADTVARYGGDEFVVLCQDVWSLVDAVAAAERLARCLDDPISLVCGATVKVGVSVGVTLALDGGLDGERLIREADTAMYLAKHRGQGGVAIAGSEDVVLVDPTS